MPQHGQELVLGGVGRAQLFDQPLPLGLVLLQRLARQDLRRDLEDHRHQADHLAVIAVQGLQVEAEPEVPLLPVGGVPQRNEHLIDHHGLPAAVAAEDHLLQRRAADLRESLEVREPQELPSTDELHVPGIRDVEHQVRTHQQGGSERRLPEELVALAFDSGPQRRGVDAGGMRLDLLDDTLDEVAVLGVEPQPGAQSEHGHGVASERGDEQRGDGLRPRPGQHLDALRYR